MISRFEAIRLMKRFDNRNVSGAKTRVFLLIALLAISGQSEAWIAFGFKSGMSRFDIAGYLSEKESLVVTEGEQQTHVRPEGDEAEYRLVYCASPQKLYLMKFGLGDSLEIFVKTKKKFEKRYGEPTPLNSSSEYWDSEAWGDTDISFIWDVNELETIRLTHTSNGSSAEFQDLSVCD